MLAGSEICPRVCGGQRLRPRGGRLPHFRRAGGAPEPENGQLPVAGHVHPPVRNRRHDVRIPVVIQPPARVTRIDGMAVRWVNCIKVGREIN